MNNQELIELVQQKPPEELSVEEIDKLREGIGSSPDLAEAIAEHIRLEEDLNETLGDVKVSVEKIVLAAAAGAALGGGAASISAGSVAGAALGSPLAGWAIGSVITAVLSSVLVLAVVVPPPAKPQVVDPLQDPTPKKVEIPEDIPAPSVGEPNADPKDGEKKVDDPKSADRNKGKKKGDGKNGKDDDSAQGKLARVDVPPEPAIDPEVLAAEEWEKAGREPQAPFADAALAEFGASFGTQFAQGGAGARPDLEFQKIFAPIPAMGGRVTAQPANDKAFWARTEGWMKFQPKWRKEGVLRIGFYSDEDKIQLHFYGANNQGVAFVYYANRQMWAAFGTTRKPGEVKPSHYALWEHDDDRYRRSGMGAIEIRHQDGLLVMTRGDHVLMAVPFAKAPSEVYLHGRAAIRGLQFFRGAVIPPNVLANYVPDRPVAFRSSEPAQLDWKRKLFKGADVQSGEGGRVTLTQPAKAFEMSYLWLPTPEAGLCEVVFQIDSADPATGVYIGDDKGKPKHIIGVFQDKRLKQRTMHYAYPNEQRAESEWDFDGNIAPLMGDGQWIKLLLGYGVVKAYASGDGIHWGRLNDPIKGADFETATRSFGIVTQPGETSRKITLRTVEVRRLGTLSSLAGDLDAPSLPVFTNPLDWTREAASRLPNGVDPQAWLRACAVRTLAGGPPNALAKVVLKGLVELTINDPKIPVATRVAALHEAADLTDTWDDKDAAKVVDCYELLGKALTEQGDTRPYQHMAVALVESPMMTWADTPSIMPAQLVRDEALGHVYAARWEELRSMVRRVAFLGMHRNLHAFRGKEDTRKLMQWVSAWERLQQGGRVWQKERDGAFSASWRHPLEEQISKEAYNILAEFEAALAGGSFADACQIISSAGAYGALGLLPDGKETQLLVSLPSAVALAMRESAGLKKTMREQFGRVGLLRVRQAMQDGNAVEVMAATVQFYGTEAADEAHLWLGDRALAGGDFAHAVGHYRQLSPEAMNIKGPQVAARIRLAAALSGREAGQPVTTSVDFGGTRLSPEEFEALVSDLRTRRFAGGQLGLDASSAATLATSPAPAQYTSAAWARFTPAGGNGGPNPTPAMGDWLGQQTVGVVAGDQFIASNRFELVSFDLNNGNQRWSRNVGGNAGKTHEAPGMPMWPLVVKDRIFARWLTGKGPELVCLDLASGKVLWTAKNAGAVLSDPIVIEDQVHVFCSAGYENQMLQVSYVIYDARNGQIAATRPLTQFRNVWRDPWTRQLPCQAVRVHDRIVATLGGTVVSVNLLGHAQWMRRQTMVPMSQDDEWLNQAHSPPLVYENSVFATQPGVRDVQCLDLETGRLKWQRPMPEVTRLIGIAEGRLLVAADKTLIGLDLAKGEPVWTRPVPGLQWAVGLGAPAKMGAPAEPRFTGLACAVVEPLDFEQTFVSLLWLDPATGSEVTRRTLADLPTTKTPLVGPLVTSGDRTWLFHRRGPREAQQEIIELKPAGQPVDLKAGAALVSVESPLPAAWVRDLASLNNTSLYTRESIAGALLGWQQVEGIADKQTGLRKEWQGVSDVFTTASTAGRPACFSRVVTLPPGSKAKLKLEVACEGNDKTSVEVRVGSKVVSNERLESGWKKWEVDLSKFAGQTVWLWVEQKGLDGTRLTAHWKRLDLVE